MNYDFRNKANQPYDSQIPMYKTPTSSSSSASGHQLYGAPMYPRVSQPSFGAVPPPGRASSYHQTSAPSSSRKCSHFCPSFHGLLIENDGSLSLKVVALLNFSLFFIESARNERKIMKVRCFIVGKQR